MQLLPISRQAGYLGLLSLIVLSFQSAQAGSATWNTAASGYWGIETNWTPATIPSTTADTATFQASSATTINGAILNVGSIVFEPGASAYTITPYNPYQFTMSGAGIVNNSGVMQIINVPAVPVGVGDEESENLWTISGNATAGDLVQYLVFGSSCGDGKTDNGGVIDFVDATTAGSATFILYPGGRGYYGCSGQPGTVSFSDSSSAQNATFTCNGAGIRGANPGFLYFSKNATAANATIVNNGGTLARADGGSASFYDESSAGNATLTSNGTSVPEASGGTIVFAGTTTADSATLIANGGRGDGGEIIFAPYLSGTPDGGTARIEVFGNGHLDISGCVQGLTTGSLEGDGLVYLGGQSLTCGTNGLSTLFSGVIQDGGASGGKHGSLAKIGLGRLTLTGANTYSGGTAINEGTLLVNNTIGSGLGSGPVQVTTGTLGGIGTIAGAVTIGTGQDAGAVLSPGQNKVTPRTLSISRQLILQSDASYEVTINSSSSTADEVSAKSVRILGAQIVLTDGGSTPLPPGTVFTVITTTSANPISGRFSNLADGGTIVAGSNTFQADYEGGDGNDLTLTVVP